MDLLSYIIFIYLIIINIIAVVITRYDKTASKIGARRIRENTLMFIGLIGGSPAMYITMKLIHHKTKHTIFMIGLPLIFIIEVVLVVFISYSTHLFG